MKKPILTGMLLASLFFTATNVSAQSSGKSQSSRPISSRASSTVDDFMNIHYPGSNYVITNTTSEKNITRLFMRMSYGLLVLDITSSGTIIDYFQPF